jgi:hypothetical protein
MKRALAGSTARLVLLGLVLLAAPGALKAAAATPAAGTDVKVDYDPHADFTRFKTWSWRKGTPAPNPAADQRLREDIETRLAARGLKRVDQGGDLEVVYHAAGENRIGVEKLGYKEPDFETEAKRVTYVRVGTVLMDMIEASSGRVVWRGQAQGIANPAYKDVVSKIDAAVDKLFEQFPVAKR